MDADELKEAMDGIDARIENLGMRLADIDASLQRIRVQLELTRGQLARLEEPALTSREVNCD